MSNSTEELDCRAVARRIHELLDGELTEEVEAAVRRHLAACAECMSVYEFEEAFLRFVSLQGKSPEAPIDLKQQILTQLDSEGRAPAT